MADAREILRRVPIFADLSDADCDAVLRVLKARQGKAGQVLFRQGDPGDTLMIVVSGQLEPVIAAPDGTSTALPAIQPGHVVGELAFLDPAPRAATVSTSTGATILEFSRQALLLLCRDHPRIGAAIQRSVLGDLSKRARAVEGAPVSMRSGRASHAPQPGRAKGRPVTAQQLRAFPVLAQRAAEDLELLAYTGALRGFARGEALMEEGAPGDAAYVILNGSVAVMRGGAQVSTLEAGALVGQLALLDRAPRSATVTAMTDTTALELPAGVFSNLVSASSPLALRFQREVAIAAARHLRAASQRFAARASEAPPASLSYHELDDWTDGSDEPIELELAVDLGALRR